MAQTIKVFCDAPTFNGYVDDPAVDFEMHVIIHYYVNDNGTAISDTQNYQYNIPPGATPFDVYGMVYGNILGYCSANSWPTPAKSDIFAVVPRSALELLPEIPAMS